MASMQFANINLDFRSALLLRVERDDGLDLAERKILGPTMADTMRGFKFIGKP
jgi:hypothetical protein